MKASADLATLVVAIVPIVLFLIMSGSIFMKKQIETQLTVHQQTENLGYENMWMTYQVTHYKDMEDKLRSYEAGGGGEGEIRDLVKEAFKGVHFEYNYTAKYKQSPSISVYSKGSTKAINKIILASRSPSQINITLKTRSLTITGEDLTGADSVQL
ncbi:MAG: hypothetical protein ABEJ83_05425 [Candidatus Nanohaloarchaea archaeon]